MSVKPYYNHGGVVIYHADCREVLPELSGVDTVFTSPPYNTLGSRIPTKPTGLWARDSFPENVNEDGYPDDVDENEYQATQNAVVELVASTLVPGGSLFYNHKCRWRGGVILHPLLWVRPSSLVLREELIWDRGGSMTLNARMFAPSEERILWFVKPGGQHVWQQPRGSALMSVWRIPVESGAKKPHPVSFPVALPLRAIRATTTAERDIVLDPYMGSGTTLVAAKNLGRRAVGIEIEERYCEVAAKRLERVDARLRARTRRPTP